MISLYNSKTDAEKAYKSAFKRYTYVYLNEHVDMFGSPYWSVVKFNRQSNV